MEGIIYLDTHAVVWLFAGETDFFTARGRELLEEREGLVSPVVLLELQYLFEIEKLNARPEKIMAALEREMDIRICGKDFHQVVRLALKQHWTRDPFDRMITAHAAIGNNLLLTKDTRILQNYRHAVWS